MRARVEQHAARTELRAGAHKLDVVVRHWPPTLGTMHPRFEGDALNRCFYNDQDKLACEIGARLWISGHTHQAWVAASA